MKIGFARLDITPRLGAEMPGAFNARHNTGVHDPLHVSAMVVDDGGECAAFLGVDALSIRHSAVSRAREIVARHCGRAIPVLAAASHTHAGGPTATCLGSTEDPEYTRLVSDRIAQAVVVAYRRRTPARLGVGVGHEETVAYNRRFWMKDGRQTTHPGKGNPDIVRVAGPIDPQVGVVGAWDLDGRCLGCLVNYTLHCTVMGGLEVSADYPYYLDRTLRAALGEECVTVFINGAYGDVTQVANTIQREREFGEKWSRRIGTILGGEALKVLAATEPQDEVRVRSAAAHIHLTPRAVSPEALAAAEALLATPGDWNTERWYARELVLLAEMNRQEPEVPAEVQVLVLGDTAIVATPGEVFCEFGLRLKQESPFAHTFVANTANGSIGYVPTPEAMGPQGGGYEPRLCRSSKLVPEAGDQLVATALRLLRS